MDWGPSYNPLASRKVLAIAVDESVYIQDVLQRGTAAEPCIETEDSDRISSISFDRSGGALLLAKKTGLVSLYDVGTGQRLRSWRGSQSTTNIVSYCRSVVTPYLVAVGEGPMVGLYDVRA